MIGVKYFYLFGYMRDKGDLWTRLLGISRERQSVLTLNPETHHKLSEF